MNRRRSLQLAFSAVFILFLLVLAYHFKPKVEVPAPARPEAVKEGSEGTLSAQGFSYRQETAGTVDYDVTADTVTEVPDGSKKLSKPVLTIPGQGKAWGDRGSFDPDTKKLRIWENAALSHKGGWIAHSSGFRLTPEGEVVSESSVTFTMGESHGSAELLRYNRHTQVAHLEGKVQLQKGDAHLACRAIAVNLDSHRGTMDGPVLIRTANGSLRAPRGTLVLSPENQLREVALGSPAEGESGKSSFTSRTARAMLTPGGAIRSVHLDGGAVVDSGGDRPYRLRTDNIVLTPAGAGLWRWTAPGNLTVTAGHGDATATSGAGAFGGGKPMEAELSGPIHGHREDGTFSSDDAELSGEDWTLVGHALVVKPAERLSADRITRRGDGSTTASGHVAGSRSPEGEPTVTFTSDNLQSAEGGYPAVLRGSAELVRGDMTLTAPVVKAPDAKTVVGEDGAKAVFKDAQGGRQTVTGHTLTYDGARHVAVAEGNARGEGRDYWIEAGTLRAKLDAGDRPVRYEASGDCRFDGSAYKGQADRLAYDPSARTGRASSEDGHAVVTEKKPYRQVSGPLVLFAERKLDVLPRSGGLSRGTFEGVQAAAGPRPAKEKKADG